MTRQQSNSVEHTADSVQRTGLSAIRYPLYACIVFVIGSGVASAEDWPMWRFDANRSAVSLQKLPEKMHLQWVRKYPRVQPAFESKRLQFDAGYEPVVMGKTLFVGSPCNDSVTAINTETGAENWKFFANGPVRFAPVAWKSKVFVASDDGHLYCLNAATGRLLWKFRAAVRCCVQFEGVWPMGDGAARRVRFVL